MTIIHRKCGTELVSSGKGDYGICPKCNMPVYHLIISNGITKFSKEVIVK